MFPWETDEEEKIILQKVQGQFAIRNNIENENRSITSME
jgi:hypothetical protein